MTSTKLLPVLVVLALIGIAFSVGYCKREPTTEPTTQQQVVNRVVAGRDKQNAELAIDTLRYLAQLEATQRTLNRLTLDGKQKDAIIAAMQARYRKTPTLAGCDTLVHEQSGRIDSLKSEIAAHRIDSLNKVTLLKKQAGHIRDRNARIDTLNQIATEALKPRFKLYATLSAEQHPINGNASVGATGTYDRLLIGYQKGLIQNTHELKAGWLIRLKKK